MQKVIFTNILLLLLFTTSYSQIIFSESFESTTIPVDWRIESDASDGGWKFGTSEALSSQSFEIESNGSQIAATNDDGCNCDKRNEYLISKPIDLSGVEAAVLKFDLYFGDQTFEGAQEDATVEISEDGINWTVLDDLHGHGGWDQHFLDISAYVGDESVYVAFRYDDNGGWLYGLAIDNVAVEVPNSLDASLAALDKKVFGEIGKDFNISGTLLNLGVVPITSLEMQYTVNGENPVIQTFENLNINGFTYSNFQFDQPWMPSVEGVTIIDVDILSVNGTEDDILVNNSLFFTTDIYGEVVVPNNIRPIVFSQPNINTVATFVNGLDRPTDLEFFPVLGKDELWIINQRTENVGGSTVTITDATAETPSDFQMKVDGNSWHFMSLPTALAFSSDNFNFANSAGVQDANHGGGTFTGPALWSSDPDIYAQPSGGNGSHLDMLHGSPFSMGIAHEVDNVFWVYDDWNEDIVRYDFADDHGPGNDDHSDGELYRYQNIGIQRDGDIPNHMILDKSTGWMYFVDNGNSRVMRLDINSGSEGANLALINEPLAVHVDMEDFTVETIISEGLDRPCGIEYFDDLLLVGNYGNGDINVYDTKNEFELIGTIETGNVGLTGITVGPDGNIFAVNRIDNSLVSISEGSPTNTIEYADESEMTIYPNPAKDMISLEINGNNINRDAVVKIYNYQGQQVYYNSNGNQNSINVSHFNSGIYIMEVTDAELVYKKKFSIMK